MSNWKINPKTRDYEMVNGRPVQDDSLKTPAYIRLMAPRLRWMYAPDANYGSEYYAAHTRVKTTAEIEKMATRALQPMVDDGRANSVDVETTEAVRGAIALKAKITNDQGIPEVLEFTPLGVK